MILVNRINASLFFTGIEMKKVLKRSHAAAMAGVCTDQIKNLIEMDGFPKPIKVGKIDGWVDTEIQAWIDAKIAERDAAAVTGGAE